MKGFTLGLNLVLVQSPWARAAASRGATVGRQDIPAQDEEMSVTTCYANPRAEEGKSGEGECTGKTVSTGTVCLCAHWQDSVHAGLCVCVCVCVLVENCPTAGWELTLSR